MLHKGIFVCMRGLQAYSLESFAAISSSRTCDCFQILQVKLVFNQSRIPVLGFSHSTCSDVTSSEALNCGPATGNDVLLPSMLINSSSPHIRRLTCEGPDSALKPYPSAESAVATYLECAGGPFRLRISALESNDEWKYSAATRNCTRTKNFGPRPKYLIA
jgi:hypothetical protein